MDISKSTSHYLENLLLKDSGQVSGQWVSFPLSQSFHLARQLIFRLRGQAISVELVTVDQTTVSGRIRTMSAMLELYRIKRMSNTFSLSSFGTDPSSLLAGIRMEGLPLLLVLLDLAITEGPSPT